MRTAVHADFSGEGSAARLPARGDRVASVLPGVVVWLLACALAGWWLARDQTPFPWDMSGHAQDAFEAGRALRQFDLPRIYALSLYYPPLFRLLAAPVSFVSTAPDAYCAVNWLALGAAMLATAQLARAVGSRAGAGAAAALLPGYVMLAGMLRMPMLDLLLTATTTWTLALIARDVAARRDHPDARTTTRAALSVGFSIALGLLAKWPYLFFTALPLSVWAIGQIRLRRGSSASAPPPRRLAALLLPPLLLAGPWYLIALAHIGLELGAQLGGDVATAEGDPLVLSVASLMTYPRVLFTDYMRWPLTLMLATGAVALIARMRAGRLERGWGLIALAVGSGLTILTLIANKDPRYIMPIVPLLAVVSGQALELLPERRRGWGVPACAALAAGMLVWNFTRFAPPDPREYQLESIAQWITENKTHRRQRVRVLVVPNEWTINSAALDYALQRRDGRVRAERSKAPLEPEHLRGYDYVLVLTPQPPATGIAPHVVQQTELAQREGAPVREFTRGDGAVLTLLRPLPR